MDLRDVLEDTAYALDDEDMRQAAEAVLDRLIADGAVDGATYGAK